MRIAGFGKFRNEIVREGNLYRALANLDAVCDGGILCDDASTDGTREHLTEWVRARDSWTLLRVEPETQAFENEMRVKQRMLEMLHLDRPTYDWIWWLDGDEALDRPGALRAWLTQVWLDVDRLGKAGLVPGYKFHYSQLWRNTSWARTDGGFDDGAFVKLWRYRPDLSFRDVTGTHTQQFPQQIDYGACPLAPFEIIHYGNVGKNLIWKAIQYAGGRGGVDRHIHFGHPRETSMATGVGWDESKWAEPAPTYRPVGDHGETMPGAFTLDQIRRIRSFGDLRHLKEWFTVVVPAFNRAATLSKALDSLLAQTYEQWVCVVLDDGSTDGTPGVMRAYQDRDPRIFYARYPVNRGGVAMNEIGMSMACEQTEWWTRLGSDDWFGSGKLARDARALRDHEAVYGPYTDMVDGRFEGIRNPQRTTAEIDAAHRAGGFVVSWANIAMRRSVLDRVRARFGRFCDPSLRNCEDFLLNARASSVGARFVWRSNDGELDAIWTKAREGGASSPENAKILADDEARSRALIAEAFR